MKKNKKLIRYILAAGIIAVTFTACTKEFFDINDDPNSPADATVADLLPSAEAAIAHAVGNNFQIFGGLWAQYWTQSPSSSQYKTIDQYNPGANDFDRPWKALYADALKDLQRINEKVASQPQYMNYSACAKILQAYTFQLLTDNFGDIPFSEALQAEQNILSPKYDSQKDVYDGIITILKEGLASIDDDPAAIVPGDEDLFLLAKTSSTGEGDMSLWRKFGNTLLLKIYLRLAYVDPAKAQAGIGDLEANAAEFLGSGEDVKISYLSSGGNTNPLYSEMSGLNKVQNLVASATAVNYLNDNNDPRVDVFYDPAANNQQIGIPQGYYTLPAGTLVSLPSTLTGGNVNDAVAAAASATAPVKLMTGYESLFLQSEATERSWLTSNDAQTLYEAAITESFVSSGFTTSDASDYYTQVDIAFPGGPQADNLKAILTQKWIAMCGSQNDEAWIEWRRTDFPDFFTESVNTKIGVGSGRFPERCFYPNTELTRNGKFPGQKLIYEKMWWDVN